MSRGLTFAFDANKETPQDVARRRAIAEAIMGRSMAPKNVGEGFGAIANGIVANVQNRRAQAGEQAGQAGANDIFGRIMSGLTGQPYSGQQSSFEQNATPLDPASSRVASAHSASASPGSFSGSQQEFVDMLMPAAMEASQRTGIDPRIIVAQAAQETGWGRSAPGNNFFGIKSHGKGGGQTFNTHEYVNGKRVNISDSFRQFGSPEESVAGYADFILENPRYRKLMGAQGLDAQLEALQASGYATDPNYSRSVGSIARGIEIPDAQQALENLAVGEATTLPSMDVPVQDDPQMAMASPQMPMPQQQMGMQPPQIPQQAQQPVQMAQAGGLDLQTLMEAAANPFLNEGQRAVVNSLLQQQLQQQDPMRQLDMDYKRAQIDKMGREASGQAELGLNPQYGVDANGNPVLIQIGKDGKAVQTSLPEGVQLSKEPIRMDAGTHFVLLDPITRQPVGQIPKENREAARETAIGKIEGETLGEAQVNLGSTLQKADQSIALIDQMLEHPGFEAATGLSSVLDPRNYIAGTDATNFNVMRKQLEGKAFLEAFESLKGGGQITEIEGQKATEAIARLSTTQSESAYREALSELKGILETGKSRALQRAGQGDGWQDMGGVRIRRKQ